MLCDYVIRNLSTYLDGELPDGSKELLVQHLEQCPACMKEKERLVRTANLIQKMELPRLGADVLERLMATITSEDKAKAYHLFKTMLGLFGILAAALIVMISLSPFGQIILAIMHVFGRNILDLGSLVVKILTRSPLGFQGWSVSLTLFLGFLFSFWALRKVLNNSNLGGPLHE